MRNSDAFAAGLTGAYTGLINRHFNTILNEIPVSYMEDKAGWHGKAPNDEEYAQGMAELAEARKKLEA